MNIILWIIQAILAIKLLTTSLTHGLRQSKPEMQDAIRKMGEAARPLLFLVAIVTLLGAFGLILPGLLKLAGFITPIAAATLAAVLLLSSICHLRSRKKPKIFISLVLFVLAVFVAYGRWVLAPF